MDKTTTVQVPDFHQEWEEEFEKLEPQLLELIKNNDNIHIVVSFNPVVESLKYMSNPNYVPRLLSIYGNTIITREYNPMLANLIMSNMSEDTHTLTIDTKLLNNPDFIEDLYTHRNLREIYLIGEVNLDQDQINYLLQNTALEIIHTPCADRTNIEGLPTAIKYNGDFQATYNDGLLIINDKRFDSKNQFFYSDDILANLDTMFRFLMHNGINMINKNLNIISVGEFDENISYSNETKTMEYKGPSDKLESVIHYFESYGLEVDTVIVELYTQEDNLEPLKKLPQDIQISYSYYFYDTASIEDFETVRDTFNYYKDLITAYPLSPIEQITFAYDLMKSYSYEDNEEDKSQSRKIHNVITTGKCVCVGYSKMLKQLLTELGYRAEALEVETYNSNRTDTNVFNPRYNHMRLLVRIDDDKYNIHGLFALDPTWDRNMTRYEVKDKHGIHISDEEPKKYKRKYDTIISYIHFLVNKKEYNAIYGDKHSPAIFSFNPAKLVAYLKERPALSPRYKDFIDEGCHMLERLFDEDEYDLIESYMMVDRPSLDVFKEILYNVGRAEGYTTEQTERNLENIEQYNRSIYQYEGTPVFTNHEVQQFTSEEIKPRKK